MPTGCPVAVYRVSLPSSSPFSFHCANKNSQNCRRLPRFRASFPIPPPPPQGRETPHLRTASLAQDFGRQPSPFRRRRRLQPNQKLRHRQPSPVLARVLGFPRYPGLLFYPRRMTSQPIHEPLPVRSPGGPAPRLHQRKARQPDNAFSSPWFSRYLPGEMPMTRRNTFPKELSDSYPTADAIAASFIGRLSRIMLAARTIRHWVR
jgi:hypothetical protein